MWHPTNEVWLPVQKNPKYEVSNLGRFRRKNKCYERNKITPEYRYLKGNINRTGYRRVDVDGKHMCIAHAVLEAFVGPRPVGMQCDHVNRIRDDNRMVNLRWVTHAENMRNRAFTPDVRARMSHSAKNRNYSEETLAAIRQHAKDQNQARDPKTGRFIKSM